MAIEYKNVDVSGSTGNLAPNSWSEIDFLNPVDQGTGGTGQRIGRKFQMKSILFRYNTSSSTNGNPVRILIVYDKQTDGILPTANQIVTSATNINAPMNMSNTDRFVIIADEMVNQNSVFNGAQTIGTIYRKLNLPAHYNGGTAAIADMASGSIYVMSHCLSGGTGTGVGYVSRIRYTDF